MGVKEVKFDKSVFVSLQSTRAQIDTFVYQQNNRTRMCLWDRRRHNLSKPFFNYVYNRGSRFSMSHFSKRSSSVITERTENAYFSAT